MDTKQYLRNLLLIFLLAAPYALRAANAPITTAAIATACPGATITIPVTVVNFANILEITLRIDYDETMLHFNTMSYVNPAFPQANFASSPVSGTTRMVKFVWTASDFNPVALPDGSTIFTISFQYYSGTAALTFNNTDNLGGDCEYADQTLQAMNDLPTSTYYHNGQVSSAALAGTVSGGSTIYFGASTGSLPLAGYLGTVLNWQKQYNGGGFTDIAGTSGQSTYSETPAYTGTWDYRAYVQTPCSSLYSTPTTVTVLTPVGTSKTWTGTAGTDWKSPTNWSPPGTPIVTDNVIIPAGTPSSPVILISTANCNNLFLSKNAALTVNPAKNLNVAGTLTIEGP